jgi:type I restriction enzyme R subunit
MSADERALRDADDRAVWEALATEAAREQARLAQELAALQAAAAIAQAPATTAIVEGAAAAAAEVVLDEAATRRLIDEQLRLAGWEADSEELTHASGARPQKNKNLAIAEWPTKTGPADYVLFIGLQPVAVVEAKRKHKDVSASLEQSKRYSRGYSVSAEQQSPGGPWGEYKVPFLFATNGRPFLRQLIDKSGIWLLDVRREANHGRALEGWYTPDGLAASLRQDIDKAHEQLQTEPTEYLGLRDYQLAAIRAVETAIAAGQRDCLVAMATGTGKTRTCIGFAYRLLKTKRFRRMLFLVDRSALGRQTADAFKDAGATRRFVPRPSGPATTWASRSNDSAPTGSSWPRCAPPSTAPSVAARSSAPAPTRSRARPPAPATSSPRTTPATTMQASRRAAASGSSRATSSRAGSMRRSRSSRSSSTRMAEAWSWSTSP